MTSLRVTAGALRGRRIAVPPRDVRPTSERARQAYFNIVADRMHEAVFLDLFAGSGIFSFEAISRGAASAVAVEQDRRNADAIAARAAEWEAPIRVVTGDVLTSLGRLGATPFDLIYADPPYAYPHYRELLAAIDAQLRLGPAALVAIEHQRNSSPFDAPTSRLRQLRRAEYGEVWITFFAADDGTADD